MIQRTQDDPLYDQLVDQMNCRLRLGRLADLIAEVGHGPDIDTLKAIIGPIPDWFFRSVGVPGYDRSCVDCEDPISPEDHYLSKDDADLCVHCAFGYLTDDL